jgi:hypothetical protein
VSVGVDGVSPFITTNADFYRIDTALTVPQVPTDGYALVAFGTDRTRTSIKCRAIDGIGMIQTDERTEPLPNGASGHHSVVVFIE